MGRHHARRAVAQVGGASCASCAHFNCMQPVAQGVLSRLQRRLVCSSASTLAPSFDHLHPRPLPLCAPTPQNPQNPRPPLLQPPAAVRRGAHGGSAATVHARLPRPSSAAAPRAGRAPRLPAALAGLGVVKRDTQCCCRPAGCEWGRARDGVPCVARPPPEARERRPQRPQPVCLPCLSCCHSYVCATPPRQIHPVNCNLAVAAAALPAVRPMASAGSQGVAAGPRTIQTARWERRAGRCQPCTAACWVGARQLTTQMQRSRSCRPSCIVH